MKGKIIIDETHTSRMFTCISTCEKGIYESHQLEAERRINYQMLPSDDSIAHLKYDRGEKKICISF
ncbi:hypothetical protein AYK21_02660 [Thermoplasmatales archaeon SG8-52-2]|nr:MAG: hypothetical protein AYK21_02660 [Thermoplasmatales archaeon SG8-52-2]